MSISITRRKMLRNMFKSTSVTRLGRWARSSNQDITFRKVELANYDHCGTCPTVPQLPKVEPFDSSMDISICALQSLHSYPSSNHRHQNDSSSRDYKDTQNSLETHGFHGS